MRTFTFDAHMTDAEKKARLEKNSHIETVSQSRWKSLQWPSWQRLETEIDYPHITFLFWLVEQQFHIVSEGNLPQKEALPKNQIIQQQLPTKR